ncbi:alpha/beta hydrolase [Luteimonas aestuarii]|uniref:Alpha/beta hydrolase n=1 Tax=Luteimonas aestuarii TaxID=453837 RepID=A0A4R5TPH0_9GAMM|nr:alpha/beta hydrolase [Luteimonas aestuarii]TDK23003.1 alpha/beta hydrolase [Luteimonas aestuarii]
MTRLKHALIALLLSIPLAHAEPVATPGTFLFDDGHASDFHEIIVGDPDTIDTIVFTYGGSGCTDLGVDWLSTLARGMAIDARYVSLNKRHVRLGEDGKGSSEHCTRDFNAHNLPHRWWADYMAFITRQLGDQPARWKNVVLVGGSEGGEVAARVARSRTDVTHLLVIGRGGWGMRDILGSIIGPDAVEDAWRAIANDPDSLDTMWMGHPHRYWAETFDRDPLRDFLALDIPVLIGFGERDLSNPVASAQDVLRAAHAAGKRNIGLVVYPAADHSLHTETGSHLLEFLGGAGRGIATGELD